MLGLCCYAWAFPSCSEWGPLLIAVHGPLIEGASPVAEHGLQAHEASSCGTRAQQLWHTSSRMQAPRHVGSSWTRAQTCVRCIGRRILNHCTTREAPVPHLLYPFICRTSLHIYIYLYICNIYVLYVNICIYLFIYSFLSALGLRCCVRAFSNCSKQELLFIVVCGLLIAVASLVAEHGL